MFETRQDNCRTATRRRWASWAAILVAGGVTASTMADTLYVDATAPIGGDGGNWNNAYRFLQDALAAAGPGSGISEIRVAQGVYQPDRSAGHPFGTGNREASFQLISNVPLRGGYAGLAGSDPNERDIAAFETILSGDLLGNDGPAFEGYEENSYTVVYASGADGNFMLEGVTVSGGNANEEGSTADPPASRAGGGAHMTGGHVSLVACTFRANYGRRGGGAFVRNAQVQIDESNFLGNSAPETAGGLELYFCSSTVSSTVFKDNEAINGGGLRVDSGDAFIDRCDFLGNSAEVGGGLQGGSRHLVAPKACLSMVDCMFVGNLATVGGGGAVVSACDGSIISNCVFRQNSAGMVAGAVSLSSTVNELEVRNCTFTENTTGSLGGTIADGIGARYINCLVANNVAGSGGTFFVSATKLPELINCTVAFNTGYGFTADIAAMSSAVPLRIINSILWSHPQGHFHASIPSVEVNYSNIQGGWPGIGNIDADPLFVQPFNVDYRLSFGSPCVDMGDNASVPSHITTDLAGNERILNGVVDMGAYEGEFEPDVPIAYAEGINEGELRVLVPMGLPHQPIFKPAAVIWNISGGDGAWAKATQYATEQHSGAGGYKTLGPTLKFETSIEDGDLYARVFISINEEELNGIDPVDLDLTFYNPATNNWHLAVSNNTENSPGHKSPVGERHVQIDGTFVVSPNLGDYGVYWRQDLQRVLVWAVVDHANANFRPGYVGCVGDIAEPQGHVSTSDLLELLTRWGDFGGPADLNWDGVVDVSDLLQLLANWGPCP